MRRNSGSQTKLKKPAFTPRSTLCSATEEFGSGDFDIFEKVCFFPSTICNNTHSQCFLQFNEEMIEGSVRYLTRNELSEDEKYNNIIKLMAFYDQRGLSARFIDFCAKRNAQLHFDGCDNTTNPYFEVIKSTIHLSFESNFERITQLITNHSMKIKNIDTQQKKDLKNFKKIKQLSKELFSLVGNPSNIPAFAKYFYAAINNEMKKTRPDLLLKTSVATFLLIPVNIILSVLLKVFQDKNQLNVLTILADVFRTMSNVIISNERTDSEWINWVKNECADLLVDWKLSIDKICSTQFDPDVISFGLSNYSQQPVNYYLATHWQQLGPYLDESAFRMIKINMTKESNDLVGKGYLLIKELNQLRVSTFNENQNYLQRMSEMKMRMKDLYEERRYLKRLVREKLHIDIDDGDDNQQETKEQNE